MQRFAIILTHNRPELLRQTWEAIGPQVDMVIIIDNASDPPVDATSLHASSWKTAVIQIPDQPPNISRMWNQGIDALMALVEPREEARIAILCDDAPPPAGWFDAVTAAMAETGAVVGCSAPEGFTFGGMRVKTEPDSKLMERMPGWAWILDPVSPVRPDESMLLWWADTSVDWDARKAGGMVMIGSHPVPNILPSGFMATHPELIAQAGQDGLAFAAKWGFRPW
jgi:hypothetical protein